MVVVVVMQMIIVCAGSQGDRGLAGATGATGTTGSSGGSGPAGPPGPGGQQGSRGVVGPPGPQGLIGQPGLIGPQGDTGMNVLLFHHTCISPLNVQFCARLKCESPFRVKYVLIDYFNSYKNQCPDCRPWMYTLRM